jgi:hypothetical protein
VYSCPLSVKTIEGTLVFEDFYVLDNSRGELAPLAPMPARNIQYTFLLIQEYDPYLLCTYGKRAIEIIVRVTGATACGLATTPRRAVCWTTDPYEGKK